MSSYRMRMYKRRLWEQRAKIVGVGLGAWLSIVTIVILLVSWT
jgi:hypothetical protein